MNTTNHGTVADRITRKQQNRRHIMDVLYDLIGDQPAPGMSVQKLASIIGEEAEGLDMSKYMAVLRSIGVLHSDIVYATKDNGMAAGRHSTWSLPMPYGEAVERLAAFDAAEIEDAKKKNVEARKKQGATRRKNAINKTLESVGQPEPTYRVTGAFQPTTTTSGAGVTVRLNNGNPVEAITGPDAPSAMAVLAQARKDEDFAIVAAARQYKERGAKVEGQIEALLTQARDLGLHVDEETLRSSIHADVDDRLENVALALPYIDTLERRLARAASQVESLRNQIADNDRLNREVTALRKQNQQLIARQVAN